MKNMFKYLAAMAMGVALMGMVACTDPEVVEENLDIYAFQFNDQTVADGATVYFTPSISQVGNDWAQVYFYMENKSDANVETVMKVERMSGSAELDNLSICFGETCKAGTCPWTSDAFTLVPGLNRDLPVIIDYSPSVISGTSVYRITIGQGAELKNSRVMLLDITGNGE